MNIIEIVGENLQVEERRRLRKVKLKIGALSNVVPESLDFCFTQMVRGTPMENAKLEMETVAIIVQCENCGAQSGLRDLSFRCTVCGGTDIKVISGNELQVVEIELEE